MTRFLAKDLEVRLGDWNLSNDTDCDEDYTTYCTDPFIDLNVTELKIHPDYTGNKNKFNDIALLRLRASVDFSNFVSPICLPFDSLDNEPDFTNKRFDITGWGKIEYFIRLQTNPAFILGATENDTNSNIKLRVDVPFVPLGNCQDKYKETGVLIKNKQV